MELERCNSVFSFFEKATRMKGMQPVDSSSSSSNKSSSRLEFTNFRTALKSLSELQTQNGIFN
jgi:hypothetical protein